MAPTLRPGDRLLVRYGAAGPPRRLVVVAGFARRHRWRSSGRPRGDRTGAPAGGLRSDNPRRRAWTPGTAGRCAEDDVLAVVRWRLWPRPGRLPLTRARSSALCRRLIARCANPL